MKLLWGVGFGRNGLEAEGGWDRLLCLVWMFGAGVDFEFGEHVSGQGVFLGQHALDGKVDQVGGLALEPFAVAFHLLAVVAVVPSVMAVFEFATRHLDLFGVDHDHIFAGIDVWGVFWAMLAHENHRDLASQAS